MLMSLTLAPSCLTEVWITQEIQDTTQDAYVGNPYDTGCWPGGRDPSSFVRITACPDAYYNACAAEDFGDGAKTAFGCCPSGFSCDYFGDEFASDFGSTVTVDAKHLVSLGNVAATTLTHVGTLLIHAIKIRYHSSDLSTTVESIATIQSYSSSQPSPTPSVISHGLNAGAIAAISIGSSFLGLAIAVGCFFFWTKRRRGGGMKQANEGPPGNIAQAPVSTGGIVQQQIPELQWDSRSHSESRLSQDIGSQVLDSSRSLTDWDEAPAVLLHTSSENEMCLERQDSCNCMDLTTRNQPGSTSFDILTSESPASDNNVGMSTVHSSSSGRPTSSSNQGRATGANARDAANIKASWRNAFVSWAWETLACAFSMIAFSAIVAVLAIEDGKPLDQWAWRIGPTAVVSSIGTLAKSSLLLAVTEVISQAKWQHFDRNAQPLVDFQMFDAAWGAAQLLVQKHIKTLLASVSSTVVIAALLVDTFMQLVFNFPVISLEDPNESGFFNRTQIYDPIGSINRTLGPFNGMSTTYKTAFTPAHIQHTDLSTTQALAIEGRMQVAIISAIFRGILPEPAASCSTGNCTWTNVTTLGICAGCTNITSTVETSCYRNETDFDFCDYALPTNNEDPYVGGTKLTGFTSMGESLWGPHPTTWNSSTYLSQNIMEGRVMALVGMEAVQFHTKLGIRNGDPISVLQRPTAWQRSFTLCEKIYKAITMTNGVSRIPEAPKEKPLILTYSEFTDHGSFHHLGLSRILSPPSICQINAIEFTNLATYLDQLFSTGWRDQGVGVSSQIENLAMSNMSQWLAEATDLNQKVQYIAESMTEVMRNGRNSTAEAATALQTRTYIKVAWAWLALP